MNDERGAIIAVAAITALLALPFVLSPFFIAQDLPAHIETAAQILALLRGDVDATATWTLHTLPWPNSLPTFALAALLPLIGGLTAGKVLTILGVVAWPTSLALLAQRLGRSPWLALLAIPTCFDLGFAYGFLHFVVGKPAFMLGRVAAIDVARRPSLRTAAIAAVAVVVMFHCHLLLFAATVPLAIITVLIIGRSRRDRVVGSVAVVVGALPGIWWLSKQPAAAGASTYVGPSKRLGALWSDLGDVSPGALDAVPWVVAATTLIVIVVAIIATAIVRRRLPAPLRSREQLSLSIVVVACAAFTIFGPVRTAEASIVAERFAAITAGLLPLLVPLVVGPRWRALLVAVGLLITGVMVVDTTTRWRAFSATQMGDFNRVLVAVPAGSRVATWFVRPLSPWAHHNALWHWPKLVSLRGSSTDDAFAWRDTCVLGLRDGVSMPPRIRLTAPSLRPWDFLLVQGHTATLDRQFTALPLTLVTSTGEWRLFRVERD